MAKKPRKKLPEDHGHVEVPDLDVNSVEYCPKRDDRIHCTCWWDGDKCCACGAREEVGPEE